ncbi:amidohydrolase family protein [Halovenus marina]|uniref:amidohydrolase family protein n=1 Tax=Halovenus marina TaxID=3396621 RepID=UPI003F559A51
MPQETIGDLYPSSKPIVDVDVHVDPDEEQVAEYCEQPYRDRLLNDSAFPRDPGSDWVQKTDRLNDANRLTDPERVRSLVQEQRGVDHPVLNLNTGIQKLPTDDLAVHLMRAYNDYFLDHFLTDEDVYGLAEITPQKPDAAAAEIERLADEPQIVGAFIGNTGPERPLGDPRYDIIYRAAEANDLPVVFHPSAGPHFRHDFTKQNQGMTNSLGVETLSGLWSQTMTFASLIVQGVPEKFSDLDFVFLETGPSWVPYMMWRLNKEYSIQKPEAPLLTQSPEKYVRKSFYFASDSMGDPNDSDQLRTMIDSVGAESMLFASNAPFDEYGDREDIVDSLAAQFTVDELEGLLYDTAAGVFGIDA